MTYGYDFSWGNTRVRGEGFRSLDESRARLWAALDAFGYVEPKWYEFWRWGETRPSPRPAFGLEGDG